MNVRGTPATFRVLIFLLLLTAYCCSPGCSATGTASFDSWDLMYPCIVPTTLGLGDNAFSSEFYMEVLRDPGGPRIPRGTVAVDMEIATARGTLRAASGDNGIIIVPITEEIRDNNLPVHVTVYGREWRPSSKLTIRIVEYTLGVSCPGQPVRTVLVDGMSQTAGDGYTIFYESGCEETAAVVFAEMKELRATIRVLCGVVPPHVGVVIVNEAGNYYTPSLHVRYPLWTFHHEAVNPASGRRMATLAHEWAEDTLSTAMGDSHGSSRKYDPATRFVFEGIADYVAFHAYGKHRRHRFADFIQHGVTTFDLREFATDEWSAHINNIGYPASFCFWHELAEQHGEAVLADFFARWRQAGQGDYESMIQALHDSTNDPSLDHRIRNMDLAACEARLKRLANEVTDTLPDDGDAFYGHSRPSDRPINRPPD